MKREIFYFNICDLTVYIQENINSKNEDRKISNSCNTANHRKENDLILATAHTRQTTKAYIYSIQFHNQIPQQEPI